MAAVGGEEEERSPLTAPKFSETGLGRHGVAKRDNSRTLWATAQVEPKFETWGVCWGETPQYQVSELETKTEMIGVGRNRGLG
jgi:hypothetical protein